MEMKTAGLGKQESVAQCTWSEEQEGRWGRGGSWVLESCWSCGRCGVRPWRGALQEGPSAQRAASWRVGPVHREDGGGLMW